MEPTQAVHSENQTKGGLEPRRKPVCSSHMGPSVKSSLGPIFAYRKSLGGSSVDDKSALPSEAVLPIPLSAGVSNLNNELAENKPKGKVFDDLRIQHSQAFMSRMKPMKLKMMVNEDKLGQSDVAAQRMKSAYQYPSTFLRSSTKIPNKRDTSPVRPMNPRSKSGITSTSLRKSVLSVKQEPVGSTQIAIQPTARQMMTEGFMNSKMPVTANPNLSQHERSVVRSVVKESGGIEQSQDSFKMILGSNIGGVKEADMPHFGSKNHHIRSGSRSPQIECENEQLVMREFSAAGIGLSYVPPNIFRVRGLRVNHVEL